MEINAVKRQIKSGQLDRFYIFTGEELEAQRIYINKIAEVTAREVCRLDSISEVLNHKAGLIKIPRLFVVRDDMTFMQAENAWEQIDELLGDKILILQITAVDKRKKFFKHFADRVVTFNPMETDVLYKYVKKEINLSDENVEKLIYICGNNYGGILLEIDKIKQYQEWLQEVGYEHDLENSLPAIYTDSVFDYLVKDGTIHTPPEDAIFDFVDAVLQADPLRAYRLLQDCKAIGEPSLRLISVLYTNAKKVLQVQICESSDISKTTGLSAWEIKCARKNLNHWNGCDLVSMLKTLQSVEQGIKTGQIDEAIAIDYALSYIF